ncbi:trace amine-associated receptor 2-like [Acanthopagrus latus]|uniref:trace amine-associated receptor 2-like n=1 Tax=Acanthopagrus latus TaxID=8177 RepID=UPI00187CFB26|nr:trace amine-associated receptor 2-like [Acanthopagrus latus]
MKQVCRVPFEHNSERVKELRYNYVQRVLELEVAAVEHQFIFIDEAGFNLTKRRRRGRNVIGQRAIVEVPGQRGGNITMCAAITHHGVTHHHATLGPYITAHLITFLDTLHNILIPPDQIDGPEQLRSMPVTLRSMVIKTLLSCISVLTVVLNLLVIISISHFRQLHTPTNLILLSLAVSDLLVGLVVMPPEIVLMHSCTLLDKLSCAVFYLFSFILTSASVGNMVLISVDRYVAICYPLRYSSMITPRRARVMRSQISALRSNTVTVKRSEMRAARTLGVILLVFALCLLPLYSNFIAGQDTTSVTSSVQIWLFYCNSSFNPLIYAFFYPWFRKSVKVIVSLQILQPGSREAKIL